MTFADNWGSHVHTTCYSLAGDKTLWSCEELEDLSPVLFQVLFEEILEGIF